MSTGKQLVSMITVTLLLAAPSKAKELDFVHDVMPILKTYCGKCHTGEKKEGGLSMNTREQLHAGGEGGKSIAVGHANKSSFLTRLTTDDPFTRMPPEGPRVPADKIAVLAEYEWHRDAAADPFAEFVDQGDWNEYLEVLGRA